MTTDRNQRVATRLAFLAAGMAMSAWAPLVPYAKDRMGLEQAELGVLLLCLGVGSLVAMPLTGVLASRFGCRLVIMISGLLTCLTLSMLALVPSSVLLAIALFSFGAAIGTLDVSMNIQAVIVEKNQGGSLMSGFHGLFSVGGFVGAGAMTFLLWSGLGILWSSLTVAGLVAVALLIANPHLLRIPEAAERNGPLFVVPHGAVIFIGILCFIIFLAEGAMLDWSALLLTSGGLSAAQGGLGYAAFSVAMTIGRLTGDKVVQRFGGKRVMFIGGLCAAAGFFVAVFSPTPFIALAGFVLIGLGASNIVPILFTAAGRQKDMSAGLAISAVTTIGYAGILAGPAMIGFIAQASSLQLAFAGLGCAMLVIAASSNRATKN
ncbi:MAG: MFS transporter [Gammaproteobacteria bacterium]|nr:MAG: MFS transporter [Gammaproteobacteria bacterium]